ncbi:MAG: hypothetical protein AB8F74_23655 [Saprospiraceae bacterium]
MLTNHFEIKISLRDGFNYTLASQWKLYQTSLEWRERFLYSLVQCTVPFYKWVGKPKQSKWNITIEDLGEYPRHSLGRAWYNFYQGKPFSISEHYEEHDIYHTLLGYKTTIVEETRMYCFLLGSGKISFPTLFTIIIGVVFLPEFILQFYKDYRLGKKALNISKWDFRYLLREKRSTLQRMIFRKGKATQVPLL